MDTEFAVCFGDAEDESLCASAANACFARIDALETLLSRFYDCSDVAVIHALKPGEVAVVARETMEVILASAKVCAATGGAFDPTVGPIMNHLREHATTWEALDDETIADAFARGGMQRLVLDVEGLRVAVKPDALGRDTPVELDFGGVGKGYALDECAQLLRGDEFALENWLLDAGTSTLLASGSMKADKPGWPLGVGGKWKPRSRLATVLELTHGALSGSGFEIRGEHVVDVRRRSGAAQWAQVWSRAESAAIADALSTAALALSAEELERACRELSAGVLVAREQSTLLDRFRDPLRWFGKLR